MGAWNVEFVHSAVGNNFDANTLPADPDTGKLIAPATGGVWAINAATQQPKAAWDFLKFLSSDEAIRKLIVEPVRSIPPRRSFEWLP